MGARVRVDRRTNRLFLDLHIGGRRKRVFSELPATPKNIEILQAKAEAIDREAFLGTLDLARHFPERAPKRPTVADLWEEWRKKKANDVTPLTMHWYEKAAKVRLLPFWGKLRLDAIEPRHFDEFKARLVAGGSELVFPNSRGRCMRLDNLRHRVWYPALEKAKLQKARPLYDAAHVRNARPGGRRGSRLGREDARAHDAPDDLHDVLPLPAEPGAAGRELAREAAGAHR